MPHRRPGALCSDCRQVPARPGQSYCLPCATRYTTELRAIVSRWPRPCHHCGALMPAGRINDDCSACVRERRERRLRRPGRRCPSCGDKIPRGYRRDSCRLCRSLEWREGVLRAQGKGG